MEPYELQAAIKTIRSFSRVKRQEIDRIRKSTRSLDLWNDPAAHGQLWKVVEGFPQNKEKGAASVDANVRVDW